MATFKIHEDSAIKNAISKKEQISKIPKKFVQQNGKRTALNCLSNGVRQDNKRFKVSNKENVLPPQVRSVKIASGIL